MSLKIALSAFVLALTPGLALAECSYGKQASMSCADGTVYDEETRGCVPTSS